MPVPIPVRTVWPPPASPFTVTPHPTTVAHPAHPAKTHKEKP